MVDKKETIGYVVAVVALIGCCLLLTAILAGGGLTIIGVSLNKRWLLILGSGIIMLASVILIWKNKRGVKNGKKENK